MSHDWKNNPFVIGSLLAMAAVVWGTFLLRVQADQTFEMPSATLHAAVAAPVATAEIPYAAPARDPFAPFLLPNELADESGAVSEAQGPPPVRHRLHGVIGRTAILIDPAGESHIVRAGDSVGDIEVVSVGTEGVVIRRGAHTAELTLSDAAPSFISGSIERRTDSNHQPSLP